MDLVISSIRSGKASYQTPLTTISRKGRVYWGECDFPRAILSTTKLVLVKHSLTSCLGFPVMEVSNAHTTLIATN